MEDILGAGIPGFKPIPIHKKSEKGKLYLGVAMHFNFYKFWNQQNLVAFIILMTLMSPCHSAESIQSCYQKILTYIMGLGHLPSEAELDTAIMQCDGTFDEVEAVVQSCHQEKINQFVAIGRPPTSTEMDQAIEECSALAQETVENSLPDPCANGPEGFENFIPEQYVELYASGDPQFLETFNTICQEQAEQIKSSIVDDIAGDYEQLAKQQYQDAVDMATANNWLISSQGLEIKYLSESGVPIYNQTVSTDKNLNTRNYQEANLSGTDTLWNFFTGSGLTIGLWDAGSVNNNHTEYLNRVEWNDSEASSIDFHPTHITGTLIASGNSNTDAKGMAPDAKVSAYNWNYNISELLNSAAKNANDSGLLISNHSYGVLTGWTFYPNGVPNFPHLNWEWSGLDCVGFPYCSEQEDYKLGLYNQDAFDLDYVSYLLPYHLIVKAAGNNSQEGPEPGTSHLTWRLDGSWSQIESSKTRDNDCSIDGGYDCLMPDSTAKNILTVGAIDGEKNLASYSSKGPTDDGRIKPDIVAKGDAVLSTWTDGSYSELSGTSMATPVVSGSLTLLQQKYRALNQNQAMRAATLKGLAIHTADDIAPAGPDYSYGWGILNTQRAASLLNKNNSRQQVSENRLNNNETFQSTFVASSSEPIVATLSWTDYPMTRHEDMVDPNVSVLTNDLDLRVIGGGITFYPWRLDASKPSQSATQGDNNLDNVEQVVIYHPIEGETYQVLVSHKNTLQTDTALYRESCGTLDSEEASQSNPHQCFSLIVSQGDSGIIKEVDMNARAENGSNGLVNLYLPAVSFQGQTFSASLEMLANTNPLQFRLMNYGTRGNSSSIHNAELDPNSFDLNIPQLSFMGQNWQVYLTRLPGASELLWSLSDIQLIEAKK